MQRREALQRVGLLLGSFVATPAMAEVLAAHPVLPTAYTAEPVLSAASESLLAEVANVIIPDTPGSPGAKAAGVAPFINLIVSECYPEAARKKLREGMNELAKASGKSFTELSEAEKVNLLKDMEAKAYESRKADAKAQPFWFMLKDLVTTAYFTSEVGATQALEYVYIPGKYEGCIDMKPGQKAWAT